MSGGYWEGATWVFNADITNDGSNSGTHEYDVSPGAGNEMEILYGMLRNDDAAGRVTRVVITDATTNREIANLAQKDQTLAAGAPVSFPNAGGAVTHVAAGSRLILSGGLTLHAQVAAVAVSQDTEFSIVARIRGGVPTVVLTSPTDAVETVNLNMVL